MRGDARWQNLDRDVAPNAGISRPVDLAHAAGAHKGDHLVMPERSSEHRSGSAFSERRSCHLECGRFQETLSLFLASEQRFYFAAHLFIGTGFFEEPISLPGFTFAGSMIKLLDLAPRFSLHSPCLG